jgi:hypothetical protein
VTGDAGNGVAIAGLCFPGWRGLFRGTAATLSREVPFYVLGMMGYTQLKRIFNGASDPGG